MKFHTGSTTGGSIYNTRFPVIDGRNIYSPLVYSANNIVVSPWKADIVVYPNRTENINQSTSDNFGDGGSVWPTYLNGNGDSRQKVISAYMKDETTPYYYSKKSSNRNINATNWAKHYYGGFEYHTNSQGYYAGPYGGVFWNVNNFSAITTDPQKLVYGFGAIVSLQSKMFYERKLNYKYTWGGGGLIYPHDYFTEFNIPTASQIVSIDITGYLQPFNYYVGVGVKGGNWVSGVNGGDARTSGMVWLGSLDNNLSAATFSYFLTAQNGVNNMVTGTVTTKYLRHNNQGNDGIVRHFTHKDDGYEYFLLDGLMNLSSMWPNHNISAISSPIFTLGIDRTNLTDQHGAIWNNATATVSCANGAVYTRTGNYDLAPMGRTLDWLENSLNFKANFYVDDLKMGMWYQP